MCTFAASHFRGMNKIVADIFVWFLLTVVAPFILPVVFALCWGMLYDASYDISILKNTLNLLFNNGVYTFFVLTVLVSLFQDYRVIPKILYHFIWLSIFASTLPALIIFGDFLGYIPKINAEAISPLKMTIIFLFVALILKICIIVNKEYKNNKQ